MRLTCPNCGAEYDVPEGLVPSGGKHVQCASCHTRWFARGTARALVSEAQDARPVEGWASKPSLSVVPSGITAPDPAPEKFDWHEPGESAKQSATPKAPPVFVREDAPSILAEATPRSPTRLDIDTVSTAPTPIPPVRSHFARGFAVAILFSAIAIAVFVWRQPLATQIPSVAPALETYATAIESARAWIDERTPGQNSAPPN